MPEYSARAKINLALTVTGKFADGYHAVDMIMQEITLADTLYINKAGKISVSCDVCPAEKNTAYRAAELFFKHTGIVGGASIEIEKRIPDEAGLGGGSSDAAAVLEALNTLYSAKLDVGALMEIAARIGMDVPFFLAHGCMRARGKGDVLTRADNRLPMRYVIIKPEEGVSTKDAYRAYDAAPNCYDGTGACVKALAKGDSRAYFKSAENALYDAACSLNKNIAGALSDAYAAGAEFAMMTGSGSAVFAVYPDNTSRVSAIEYLSKKYPFAAGAENAGC